MSTAPTELRQPSLGVDIAASNGAPVRHLEFALDCGAHHRLIIGDAQRRQSLIGAIEASGLAAVVPASGRLLANLKVWDNIILPLAYHGLPKTAELERRAIDLFNAFGYDAARARTIAQSMPERLDKFERRLAAFVRALLAEPQILVLDATVDGLAQQQRAQALSFGAAFLHRFPFRTVVHIEPEAPQDASGWVEI